MLQYFWPSFCYSQLFSKAQPGDGPISPLSFLSSLLISSCSNMEFIFLFIHSFKPARLHFFNVEIKKKEQKKLLSWFLGLRDAHGSLIPTWYISQEHVPSSEFSLTFYLIGISSKPEAFGSKRGLYRVNLSQTRWLVWCPTQYSLFYTRYLKLYNDLHYTTSIQQ